MFGELTVHKVDVTDHCCCVRLSFVIKYEILTNGYLFGVVRF